MLLLNSYILTKFVGHYNTMAFCFIKKCDSVNSIVKTSYHLNTFWHKEAISIWKPPFSIMTSRIYIRPRFEKGNHFQRGFPIWRSKNSKTLNFLVRKWNTTNGDNSDEILKIFKIITKKLKILVNNTYCIKQS